MTEVQMMGEDIEFVGSDWVLSVFFKASGRLIKSNGETLLLAVFASSLSKRGIVLVRLACGFRTTVGRLPWASISLMPRLSLGITWAPFSSNGALAVTGLRVTVWPSLSVSPLKMTPVPAPESIGLPLSSSGWELVKNPPVLLRISWPVLHGAPQSDIREALELPVSWAAGLSAISSRSPLLASSSVLWFPSDSLKKRQKHYIWSNSLNVVSMNVYHQSSKTFVTAVSIEKKPKLFANQIQWSLWFNRNQLTCSAYGYWQSCSCKH